MNQLRAWLRIPVFALTATLAGCSPQGQAPVPAAPAKGAPLAQLGAGEGAVSIVAWAGYIERGETAGAWSCSGPTPLPR